MWACDWLETFGHAPTRSRVCTKSRRAKVRQGKNRRGTAGVAFDFRGLNEHSEPVFNAAWPA
ncbi:hypothetical protein C1Y31_07170 [Pseudomonas sp. FW305-25]|nr:hypothetical protein C1Y31_07170 [Pseudomonas sp. FW305-25]PMY74033.1 hypothetical protein C1Y32_05780 [Pseudomonas sp. FW126-L8]PNA82550.1 hypothetical protein C1Y33_03220 [Pseudomonas sp. FW305-76]